MALVQLVREVLLLDWVMEDMQKVVDTVEEEEELLGPPDA
jgi:hypothetical protein